ncbi:TetR/AcrR family transcriptional regulator [Microbaculum marinum]|uniref:TetR/AcrR family transcriptional regulator n=1 Tax=Microbaculum marinum TaxID=1764581 RepID=A0AAW9RUE2_9HYPH
MTTATNKTTGEKLVEAAADLLDSGGENAVTLRAVGMAAGLSHNAPYKHFANRNALLAAVAAASFEDLARAANAIRTSSRPPAEKMADAIGLLIDYSQRRPARYRLLFNNPETAAAGGELKERALETFEQFRSIVQECQEAGVLPDVPSQTLASLIFASAHGLLAMEGNGQMHPEKGLSDVATSMELLLDLLSPNGKSRR